MLFFEGRSALVCWGQIALGSSGTQPQHIHFSKGMVVSMFGGMSGDHKLRRDKKKQAWQTSNFWVHLTVRNNVDGTPVIAGSFYMSTERYIWWKKTSVQSETPATPSPRADKWGRTHPTYWLKITCVMAAIQFRQCNSEIHTNRPLFTAVWPIPQKVSLHHVPSALLWDMTTQPFGTKPRS